jgi:hypothetical protein
MGASEGTYQPERGYKNGAGDFILEAGARYHPFRLTTVLWQRKNVNAVDIHLEMLDGDKVFTIDEYLTCTDKHYSWPNEDSPCPLALVPSQRVRLRVTGANATEEQSAVVVWAELGAV